MRGKRRPNKVVAIDWDVRTVRIVHASVGKRGVKIDRLLSVGIPATVDPADPVQMGGHIRRVLDQEGIHTRHAVVDIPRDQAILKTLTLPAIRVDEMAGVVGIQIAKELPFPPGEGVIDFVVPGPSLDATTSDVLVAVARREVVQQYEAIIAKAGLKLDRVGLRPYANRVAVCEVLKFALPERVLFIDVRPTLTEIDVVRSSALVFSRAASVPVPADIKGSPRLSDAAGLSFVPAAVELPGAEDRARADGPERVIQALLLEVTRSIEAYRVNDPGAQMDHAIVAGDTGIEEALAETIQKRLGITTELYNPSGSFGWNAEEGAAAAAFSAGLGLVLSQGDPPAANFNFLAPKRLVSQTRERLRKAPIAAAAALLFVIAGGILFASQTRPDRLKLAAIEEQIRAIEEKEGDYRKFMTFMEQVRRFEHDQHVWVDVLYDVFSILPQNDRVILTQLDMDQKEGRVVLKTKAVDRETATDVVKALRDFRREGAEKPRFEATLGPQTERKGEKYPFSQDFRILVLDDSNSKSRSREAPSKM